MFAVDLDTIQIDCDPHPICARLKRDRPLHSSLNPIVERVLLESDEVIALCEAQTDDMFGAGSFDASGALDFDADY
jgi:hypothetical protein